MEHDIWSLTEETLTFKYIQGEAGLLKSSYSFDRRALPCALLLHIQDGEIDFYFPKSDRTIEMRHDDALLIPAQTSHSRDSRLVKRIMAINWIHCQARFIGGLDIFSLLPGPVHVRPPRSDTLTRLIAACLSVNKSLRTSPSLHLLVQAQRIGFEILEDVLGETGCERNILSSLGMLNRLRPVIEHIDKHLSEPFQRRDVAKLMNLSMSRCDTLFKETLGMAPLDYLIDRRMEAARIQLISSDLTVTEIAAQVGYDDPYYFSRLFKKRTGCGPRDYRENAKASFDSQK